MSTPGLARRHATRRTAAAAIAALAVLLPASGAVAFWRTTQPGAAAAKADALAAGNQPTATGDGRDIVVRWTRSGFVDGTDTAGTAYVVERHGSSAAVTIECPSPRTGAAPFVVTAALADPAPAPLELTCVDRAVPDGSWTYTVTPQFHQWVGPTGPPSTAIVVDHTAPTITITPARKPRASWYNAPVEVAVTVDDSTATVVCSDRIDGAATAVPITTCLSPFTVSTDGVHEIMVTATDAAGNAAVEKRLTIRMDRTLPLVPTLIAPAIVNGTSPLGLTLAATDATSGVATVEWFACGGAACAPLATEPFLVSTTGPDYAASWTPAAGDGPYRLRARVTDDAGNVRTSNVRNVTVDSVAPTVTITAPASGAAVGGTAVNFAATVDDVGSGVANVVFEYRPAGQPSATWTVLLDPPGAASEGVRSVRNLPQGDFEVRAVATDRAGNSSVSPPVPFTIANWRATSVALSNHADGGVRGRVDVGDRVTLGFSADVAPASACTGLVDGTDRPIAVRLADGGPNGDQLVLGSPPCDLGSISLGSAGYAIGGDVVFSATVHWSASAPAQVTVVLDALDLLADAARLATAAAGARAAYTPATTLRSAVGVPIDAGTVVRTTTTIQF